MIDFVKIGKRIAEERKYIHHMSQEQLAVDLGMYQADISNLEKAKSGSGIGDLYKLQNIADYFGLPIENLLFGTSMEAHMITYQGSKTKLRQSDKKFLNPKHKKIISEIEGQDISGSTGPTWTCGPYVIYSLMGENKIVSDPENPFNEEDPSMLFQHFYVFYNELLIGTMKASSCSLFDILSQQSAEYISYLMPGDIMDSNLMIDLVDPYILLLPETPEDEYEDMQKQALSRMDDLRPYWNNPIHFIQSVYVREDCRQRGICRLMIDALIEESTQKPFILLNLEPTSQEDLENNDGFFPAYVEAEVGQVNLNAVIAEKLGFRILPHTVSRIGIAVDENGEEKEEQLDIRKYAASIPSKVRFMIENDDEKVGNRRYSKKDIDYATKTGVLYIG